ncbi:hypothetical protein [Paenibacillus xylanilyticus]|uniref:hypothetical protein n=1 Tax=Paenibacillus xylanilyticus TaxID=248903 RepID=UPI00399EF0CD
MGGSPSIQISSVGDTGLERKDTYPGVELPSCGVHHDQNVNGSLNIRAEGQKQMNWASSELNGRRTADMESLGR